MPRNVKLLAGIILRSARSVGCAPWSVLALCLAWPAAAAQPQYRLAAGDVIEISVASVPELQRRVPIDVDGSISFPLLGTVIVAGLTPWEAQRKFQALLANKVFRMRTANGQGDTVVISPEEVTATVAEYGPVYVDGDVSKPGAYPYRLLMTARQAIALAGGYDAIRFGDPILNLADLKSEYETLWIEFAKEQAHAWRLKSELGESPNQKPVTGVPLPASEVSEIIGVETQLLSADQADRQREREFLQRSIKQDSDQIATLSEQQQEEEQGFKSDTEELQKDVDLLNKGMSINQRVTDARRAVLLSSTRRLQTVVQLMQLRKQQDEFQRKLEELDDHHRIVLLGDLQDANTRLSQIRAKLQGVDEKIQHTSVLRSQSENGEIDAPKIIVIRKSESGSQNFLATDDFELRPGDVIEVTFQQDARAATIQ